MLRLLMTSPNQQALVWDVCFYYAYGVLRTSVLRGLLLVRGPPAWTPMRCPLPDSLVLYVVYRVSTGF